MSKANSQKSRGSRGSGDRGASRISWVCFDRRRATATSVRCSEKDTEAFDRGADPAESGISIALAGTEKRLLQHGGSLDTRPASVMGVLVAS